MKIASIAAALALSLFSSPIATPAQSVPDLICSGDQVVYIDHSNLTMSKSPSTDIYRFAAGKLYLSSKERDEYLYNDVREVEPSRYTSAHMTIHFGDIANGQFRSATAVHTNSSQTKIVNLRCTRPAK